MRRYLASLALSFAAASPLLAANAPLSSASHVGPALAVPTVQLSLQGLRDEVAMVLVGSALIGLAGAVRRSA